MLRSLTVAILSLVLAWSAVPGSEPDAAPATPTSATSEPATAPYRFVGTKRCRMCHSDHYQSWRESAKGDSWSALRSGQNSEIKRRAELDPNADYTADPRCLKCHATGFGRPGGYAIPPDDDRRAAREAAERRGAGCEVCHGPGSEFTKIMRDIYYNERTYDRSELLAVGHRNVTPRTCLRCHNADAICVAWRFEGQSQDALLAKYARHIANHEGFHESFPLQYRRQTAVSDENEHAAAEERDD